MPRDRLGIKPLYYSEGSKGLLFGSETKAILQDGIERNVGLQALHDYLSFNYVPAPRTIFKHICSLPAGHVLTCSGKSVAIAPELQYTPASANGNGRSEESYCEELYELLCTTVKQHLISDVPLGVF